MSKILRIPAILLTLSALVISAACNYPIPATGTLLDTPTPSPEDSPPPAIPARKAEAPQLTFIRMLDEQNGWGITETAVLRTDDGGVTWYDVTPADLVDVAFATTHAFLDPAHAWVVAADQKDFMRAGILYRTQDGGLIWTSNEIPFGGGDLTFLDSTNGWMMADLGVGAGSNAVAVFQTVDAGQTWTRTYTNDPNIEGAADSLPLGGLKFALVPRDMRSAWIGGVIYAPGTVYLFRTQDAGVTWQPVELALPPDTEDAELAFESLRFTTPDTAFLTVRTSGATYQLAVYVSHDGGETWTLTPTLITNGGGADFVSAAEGLIWNGTQFYVTRDAATTWSAVSPDIVFGDTLARMDFVSVEKGWVTTYDTSGRYTLYVTTDGGATWEPLFP